MRFLERNFGFDAAVLTASGTVLATVPMRFSFERQRFEGRATADLSGTAVAFGAGDLIFPYWFKEPFSVYERGTVDLVITVTDLFGDMADPADFPDSLRTGLAPAPVPAALPGCSCPSLLFGHHPGCPLAD